MKKGSCVQAILGLTLFGLVLPAQAIEYKEAPELAAAVAAGNLPPVTERLPEDPEVVTPFESIGKYGGTINIGLVGQDGETITYWTGNQGLVRYDAATDYQTVIPNLAASFEVDPEGKVYTFHLRKGVKWSDGSPFTAEDLAFNMEDLVLNPDWGTIRQLWYSGGEPVKFRQIDEHTVEFSFVQPYGFFLDELAHPNLMGHLMYPKGYCSQFHPKYNTETLDELIKAAGVGTWQELMAVKCSPNPSSNTVRWTNVERPTLEPWIVSEPFTAGAGRVVFKRNPYFWQVDTEGNQLPYIDSIVATVYSDPQALLLAAMAGRVDFQSRNLDSNSNRPALAENREAGQYELYPVVSKGGAGNQFFLNLTHKDPEKRELFNKKDFRVALSVGLDRRALIDTALLGIGHIEPEPFKHVPYFHERYATQNMQYDPELANKLLDGIGLDKRGPDGMRLLPSGKPLKITIDFSTLTEGAGDLLEIMEAQWAEIGIDLELNPTEQALMIARINANDHDVAAWEGSMMTGVPGRVPLGMVPVSASSWWAVDWAKWYLTSGKEGEEPPESIKERIKLYEAGKTAVTLEDRLAIYKQIADIAADEFEIFTINYHDTRYGVKKTKLRNVRPEVAKSGQYPAALILPQTFYWED